jgi:hypothetical protein
MRSFDSATLGVGIDESVVLTLSGPQLRLIHQEITKKPTGKFSTRAIGITKVLAALSGLPQVDKKPDCEEPAIKKTRKKRVRKLMILPARTKDVKIFKKDGTKRAALIDLLRQPEGTCYEQIERATGWSTKYARDNVWFVNRLFGYGIAEGPAEGEFKII